MQRIGIGILVSLFLIGCAEPDPEPPPAETTSTADSAEVSTPETSDTTPSMDSAPVELTSPTPAENMPLGLPVDLGRSEHCSPPRTASNWCELKMAADGILLGVIEDVRFPHSERFCDGNQGHQSIEIILADPIDLETGEPAILNTVRAPQVLFAGWRPAPYWLEVNQRRLFWAYGDRYPVQTIGAGMELILPYKLVPEAPDRLASPGEVVGTLVDFPLIEVVDGVPIAQAQRCGWSIEDAGEYDFAGDIVRTSLHGRDELPGVLQACDPSTTPNTTWAATIDYWAKKTEYYGGGCP